MKAAQRVSLALLLVLSSLNWASAAETDPKINSGPTVKKDGDKRPIAFAVDVETDVELQPLASTMLDYMLPGAPEVPDIRVQHMETPSPYTKFGIKGLGEGGAVGPPAAIVSAVNDALRPLNVEIYDLPLTPERILSAIDESSRRSASC